MLGGRIDCVAAGFSVSVNFSAGVVPVWYIERGRSRPNLEPVTEVPRARGNEVAGFGISAALMLGWLLAARSIGASGIVKERAVALGVPG